MAMTHIQHVSGFFAHATGYNNAFEEGKRLTLSHTVSYGLLSQGVN